jgi:hypothetical protein
MVDKSPSLKTLKSPRSFVALAIGVVAFWSLAISASFADLFFPNYRYVEKPKPEGWGEEPYFEQEYMEVILPSRYMFLAALVVFALLALWAYRNANRALYAKEPLRLVTQARVWSLIGVIVASVGFLIYGLTVFGSSFFSFPEQEFEPLFRILDVYVPILLATVGLVLLLLRAFVAEKGAKDVK